ncbi:MAG: hypothetical protein M0R46_12750 [Candidatus Muirbacterium halophilum]|nr:hypothetical protein [Candidatus Muirbacterium halophilum]
MLYQTEISILELLIDDFIHNRNLDIQELVKQKSKELNLDKDILKQKFISKISPNIPHYNDIDAYFDILFN